MNVYSNYNYKAINAIGIETLGSVKLNNDQDSKEKYL